MSSLPITTGMITPNEQHLKVMRWKAKGLNSLQIAEKTGIALKTVNKYYASAPVQLMPPAYRRDRSKKVQHKEYDYDPLLKD